jgi:hypothetical protein
MEVRTPRFFTALIIKVFCDLERVRFEELE